MNLSLNILGLVYAYYTIEEIHNPLIQDVDINLWCKYSHKYLIEYGINNAAKYGYLDIVKYLIETGLKPTIILTNPLNPFSVAPITAAPTNSPFLKAG